MYNTRFTKIALKSLKKNQREDQMKIIKGIEDLSVSPLLKSNVKKLKASSHYRLRIGDYRVLYNVDDKQKIVWILDIRIRAEKTYRG